MTEEITRLNGYHPIPNFIDEAPDSVLVNEIPNFEDHEEMVFVGEDRIPMPRWKYEEECEIWAEAQADAYYAEPDEDLLWARWAEARDERHTWGRDYEDPVW